MKDLYRRIGLPSQTDDIATIERAVSATQGTDPASARAARHVLLHPDRKAVYDRTRNVVVRIAQLRANLGLSRAPNGLATDCGDFETSPSSSMSQLESLRRSRHASQVEHSGSGLSLGQWFGIGVAAVLVCSCIIGGLLDNNSSRRSRSASTPRGSSSYAPPPRTTSPYTTSQAPVETRAERLSKLATKRLERAGLATERATVEAAVQKLIHGQADPLPVTGVMDKNFYGEGVAPLEIRTQFGCNYYVKIVHWITKAEIMTAFVRGGQPFETVLPLGSYEIKYAAGQSWYGPVLDFGEQASYSRCDDRFDFIRTYNGYNGYTIELILQHNGNLETDPISADDF